MSHYRHDKNFRGTSHLANRSQRRQRTLKENDTLKKDSSHTHTMRQQTNFRMWKSGKRWVYGATSLMLLAGGIEPAFTPLMLKTVVQAATATTTGLTGSGAAVKMPALTIGSGLSGYTTAGSLATLTGGAAWGQSGSGYTPAWSGSSVTLVSAAATPQAGYASLNAIINAASAFSISVSAASGPYASGYNPGAGYGFLLVPAGESFTGGQNLNTANAVGDGIAGLNNAIFAGRDQYVGTGDGSFQTSSTAVILATNGAGAVGTLNGGQNNAWSSSAATGTNPWIASVPYSSVANSSAYDSMALTWAPSAGTTTGTLTMTINGNTLTYTNLTLQSNMQLGLQAAHGSQYYLANTLSINSYSATMAQSPIAVNYINTSTSATVYKKSTDTITADIGARVGVVASGAPAASDAYDFAAPSFAGYTYSGATAPVIVGGGTSSISAYYTPNSQSATFNYSLAANTPGSAWGATSSASVTSGYTDGVIPAPSVTSAPAGYTTSYVYVNTSYSTLTSAESAYDSQYSAAAGTFAGAGANPTFTIVASANSQAVTTTTAWTASNTPGASSAAATGSLQASLPSAVQYSSATTGAILSNAAYWNAMGRTPANIPAGYTISTINYNGYTLSQAYNSAGSATSMYLMSGGSTLVSSSGSNLAVYAYSAMSSSAQPAMVSAFTVPASSTEMDFTYAANSAAQGEIYLKTQASSGAALTSGASSAGSNYGYYAPNSTYNASSAPTSAGFSNAANTWRMTTGEYYNSYAVFPTDASLAVKGYSYSVLLLTSGGANSSYVPTDASWSSAAAAGPSGALLSGTAGSYGALSGYNFSTMSSAASLATVAAGSNGLISTGKIANFAVVYTPITATVTTKNTLLATGSTWKRTDNISSVTDTNGSSTDSTYINGNINVTVTGPNGYSATTPNMNVPGTYTINYTYTDPVNMATTTKTATVTVVGAYGFSTSVGIDQSITGTESNQTLGQNSYASPNDVNVIADNTPFTSLAAGATVTNATVSNLQFADNNGNSATSKLQLSDITVTNAGKVLIASGKLNQSGTYSFLVTYTYTNSAGQTVLVSTTDTITVAPPFELPFAGSWLTPSVLALLAFGLLTSAFIIKRRKVEVNYEGKTKTKD
ncbi:KxYKxGKxW signal peptide domain-containing protein [Lactococcus nasutitermitis]|uniref:KxYKxGKxW signal peptide domain-containing protein n=1 Tax=Lactococcus nasutitermitis TaxID=1652957 RepID=A0ABV9JE26_9LACT|nr:KxYKxGKxW signal peptide domain-containing protein [Lactococcus nasutitermitis]